MVFLLYQCDGCTSFFAVSSVMFGSVWTIQPSYRKSHLTGFELLASCQVAPKMQIHTHMLLGIELILLKPSSECHGRFQFVAISIQKSLQDFSLNKPLAFPPFTKPIYCFWSKLLVPNGLFTKRQYFWKSSKSGKYCRRSLPKMEMCRFMSSRTPSLTSSLFSSKKELRCGKAAIFLFWTWNCHSSTYFWIYQLLIDRFCKLIQGEWTIYQTEITHYSNFLWNQLCCRHPPGFYF